MPHSIQRHSSSKPILLDVVTPEQLRSILERRELTLRKRFQTVYNRMEETRDRLVRTDFGVPTGENADNRGGAGSDDPVLGESAEPGDETESQRTFSPERIAARRRLRIVGALQNVEQASHETIGVGAAFEDIREELINNRIDSEELTSRLKDGISDPLRYVGQQLLPGLQKQIEQLRVDADNQTAGPAQLRQVPAQLRQVIVEADAVLVEMKQILGRMAELETYNEVVELLQGIIQDQGDLNLKTRDQRRKDIRGLLED